MTYTKDNTTYEAKNHQLDGGHDESVLLSSNLEFELFTTNTAHNAFDGSELFERAETYTLRQFTTDPVNKSVPLNDGVDPAAYTCHNYPVDMNKSKSNGGKGDMGITILSKETDPDKIANWTGAYFTDGNSAVRAFKIRDMQMPQ